MAVYNDITSLKIGDNTYNLKNTTYNNATTTAAGLMSSSDKSKLDGITNDANRIELSSTDGSINLVKYTKSNPSTLLSFVSNSSFTLPSSDLAIGDGKNFPVILDAENKPFVKVPTYNSGSKIDLTTSTSDSTEDKVWSAHVLNDWMSDILGVDLEKTTANMTALEKLFEDGDISSGIISELNKKLEGAATTTALGGIKVTNVVNSTGNINSTNGNTNGKNYGVQVNGDGQAFVNVPWTDRTYNAVSGGPTTNTAPGFAGTFSVPYISQSTTGQVSITDRTITMPSTPTLKASVSGSVLTLSI